MSDLVTYNGYRFNEYSHITVNAVMVPDDAGRTTLYNRYRIRVETTIYAEDNETVAGEHFERIRDRLSKQGRELEVHHEGFGLDFHINAGLDGKRDVAFGPKPLILNWDPVGEINAVEVVWECEVCISACSRWSGLMSFNYSLNYRIDKAGYSTRTISGHIEIAMTRVGDAIPDTVDSYRDRVILPPLPNFERETTWTISSDKRRADFSIVDSQIRSPNAFPDGVIAIRGNHGIQWNRRQAETVPQTIRVSIELAQGQPRSRAVEIFKAIVQSRWAFAQNQTVFLENLIADEDLFGNNFQFSIGWRMLMEPTQAALSALPGIFDATGFAQPLNIGTWQSWKTSIAALQSHRGQAHMTNDFRQDQIIDLCSRYFVASHVDSVRSLYTPPPKKIYSLMNRKPSPRKSYLKYETYLESDEYVPSTIQISVGPDDLDQAGNEFNPSNPTGSLGQSRSEEVQRFVETQAGSQEFVWKGYAERVGYLIPRPDSLIVGPAGIVMHRIGKSQFVQKFLGNVLGQPVYAAAWKQRYVVDQRVTELKSSDLDPWEGK